MSTGEVEIIPDENGCFKWNIKNFPSLRRQFAFLFPSPNFTYLGEKCNIYFVKDCIKKISLQFDCCSPLCHSLYVEFRIHTEGKVSDLRGSKLQGGDIQTRVSIDFTDFFSGETGTRLQDRLTVFLRLKQALPVSEKTTKIGTSFEKKGNPETLKKLQEDFKSLLVSGENSDVKLVVRGKEFHAHRLILSARSPVFNAMLRHDTSERDSGTVNIDDCDSESFQVFLDYVYTGSTKHINTENVINLYTTSDKYFMSELKEVCVSFMMTNMSVETFCGIATLGLLHAEKELFEFSKYFFFKNSKKIIESKNWENFFGENPSEAYEHFLKPLINKQ